MDLGGVKGQYQAAKGIKRINDFTTATRKKAKSIGSSSDYNDDLKDDVKSVKSSTKKGRSKSGGGEEPLLRRRKTGSVGSKTNEVTADADIEKGVKKQYKQVIYLFVARDSDMFVFENHYDLTVQQAKFKAEIFEVLNYYQEEIKDEQERPPQHVKSLIFDKLQLHLHYEDIYYGLIAPESLPEPKAQRLLGEVKEEVRKLYKGNVQYMRRQNNLEHNCMSKFISPKVDVIIENYGSVTSQQHLNDAFKKVSDIQKMTTDIIED